MYLVYSSLYSFPHTLSLFLLLILLTCPHSFSCHLLFDCMILCHRFLYYWFLLYLTLFQKLSLSSSSHIMSGKVTCIYNFFLKISHDSQLLLSLGLVLFVSLCVPNLTYFCLIHLLIHNLQRPCFFFITPFFFVSIMCRCMYFEVWVCLF